MTKIKILVLGLLKIVSVTATCYGAFYILFWYKIIPIFCYEGCASFPILSMRNVNSLANDGMVKTFIIVILYVLYITILKLSGKIIPTIRYAVIWGGATVLVLAAELIFFLIFRSTMGALWIPFAWVIGIKLWVGISITSLLLIISEKFENRQQYIASIALLVLIPAALVGMAKLLPSISLGRCPADTNCVSDYYARQAAKDSRGIAFCDTVESKYRAGCISQYDHRKMEAESNALKMLCVEKATSDLRDDCYLRSAQGIDKSTRRNRELAGGQCGRIRDVAKRENCFDYIPPEENTDRY